MTGGPAGQGPSAGVPARGPIDSAAAWAQLMRRGEFEAAWRVSDHELAAPRSAESSTRPGHLQRIWDGRPIDGRRVLVRCRRDLGDTIQFARFLPALAARAASVIVSAPPAWLPLLATVDVRLELLALHDGAPDVAYDVDVEVMELAWVLRATPRTLPRRTPYVQVPPAPREPRCGLTVGVVWGDGVRDPASATTPAALAPLAAVPGVRLVAFDPDPTADERTEWCGAWAPAATVLDLARGLAATDLVISVDTVAAHLAGALGVTTWTLLPSDADWRWMDARHDTPWYPTMRLFRQGRAGDWRGVVERVTAALWTTATWPSLAATPLGAAARRLSIDAAQGLA